MATAPPPDSLPSSPPPASTTPPPTSSSPPPSSPPPSSPLPSSPPVSSPPVDPSPPPTNTSPPPQFSPPPSTPNASPPPTNQGTTPPNSNSSPPSPPSPPPPSSSNTPSSSPPPGSNGNNNSPSSPPPSHSPPTPSRSRHSPPPPRALGPPSKSSSNGSSTSSDANNTIPIVIGIVFGVGALLILAMLVCCCCVGKKKKKRRPEYYTSEHPPQIGQSTNYYNTPPPHNWQSPQQQSPSDHHFPNLPPPPGINQGSQWGPPPPFPPGISSGEMSSSTFSGPHGPPLPPPHPAFALGFTKSSFSYEELAVATSGFAHGNLLGQGGFGYVHKGVLPNGKEIAVKSLKAGSGQGDREFQAEVEIISRVHHRHLVSLVGYCIADAQKILVYEFVPNNTLEFHLYGKGRPVLDWSTRLKIALGSAKGLAYLHEDCHPRIIHRDIKAANILIEENFEAKVADFGLAKLSSDNYTHVSTRIMGTFGYLAPEYASSGKLTEKSDVFSFGVMLLELITGRRPVDLNSDMDESLVDWARPLCQSGLETGNYIGLADPRLENDYDLQEMARMVACAGASVRHSARRRPKMSQIVRALEGDMSLEHLNDAPKPSQSSTFSSTSGSAASYSEDLRKFKKMALESTDYPSSEYGQTSEYGLNPSSSSSEDMSRTTSGMGSRRV